VRQLVKCENWSNSASVGTALSYFADNIPYRIFKLWRNNDTVTSDGSSKSLIYNNRRNERLTAKIISREGSCQSRSIPVTLAKNQRTVDINRMQRWFQSFQVATTCFSCSPPDLNFQVTYICVHVK